MMYRKWDFCRKEPDINESYSWWNIELPLHFSPCCMYNSGYKSPEKNKVNGPRSKKLGHPVPLSLSLYLSFFIRRRRPSWGYPWPLLRLDLGNIPIHMQTPIHKQRYTQTDIPKYTHTHTYTCTQIHIYPYICKHLYTHRGIHRQIYTSIYTHTRTHVHKYTYTARSQHGGAHPWQRHAGLEGIPGPSHPWQGHVEESWWARPQDSTDSLDLLEHLPPNQNLSYYFMSFTSFSDISRGLSLTKRVNLGL